MMRPLDVRTILVALLIVAAPLSSAGSTSLPAYASRTVRHRTEAGDWRLDISRNQFSQDVVCRLRSRNRRAVYSGGAVGFKFPRRWNVHEAVYRLDSGAPRAWRNDLPELLRLRTPVDTGGMDNPSSGIVWIPMRLLADANSVVIEPRLDRRPQAFHFRGLKGLYDLAVEAGCVPDSRFVR
jgi:hypothetical protein